ncbi:MAG: hypothetical protein ACFFBP_04025 [Promethearchaeota archaeon]
MAPPTIRLIIVYISLPIVVVFFLYLAYKILKRSKQRISKIFSALYISTAFGNIINMFYAPLEVLYFELLIIVLHVLTLFFIFFGIIFILVSNLIILSSTTAFTATKQNLIIIFYGILLGCMALFIPLNGISVNREFISEGYPIWTWFFFLYVVCVVTGIGVIPILYTSFKIYRNFTNEMLKKKWLYYIIGVIGLLILLYGIMIANLLNIYIIRVINTVYSLSVILWVLLMYYGIGRQLKSE